MSAYQKINSLLKLSRNNLLLLFLAITTQGMAQEIRVEAYNEPLNSVLYKIAQKYEIQISFNDKLLEKEIVNIKKSFPDFEGALNELLPASKLSFKKQGDIYIIVKYKKTPLYISGFICDRNTEEALPYAHVLLNNYHLISDLNGRFSLESEDSIYKAKIYYLGYYILDTTLSYGSHTIPLSSQPQGLSEVIIEGKQVEKSMELGDEAGQIRLNHKTAKRIPGNGDNSVFNFLRLQPGILAAGEQSGDLIIWGGYEGHSKVLFDGFTLFGLKNFNDNISAINPYMAKDIMVFKGGYGAEYGNRVGGIIDITGITGSKTQPQISMNINNMTMSGMASVPVKDNSALILAFRRTYYNLYSDASLLFPSKLTSTNSLDDINVFPAYTFGDFNLKFAGNSKKTGSYFLSLYSGSDDFSYEINQERSFTTIEQNANEDNSQKGGSLYWGKELKPGIHSDILVSFSKLKNQTAQNQLISKTRTNTIIRDRESTSGNDISETTITNRYNITRGENNKSQINAGFGYALNSINLLSQDWEEDLINTNNESGRVEAYLTDRIRFGSYLTLVPGIRMDLPLNLQRAYVQPRFSFKISPSEMTNLYFSWGLYNQFISKTSMLDENGNYQYFWALADNVDVPVLKSSHYVAGFSLQSKQLLFSTETYYKTTEGITRYINNIRENTVAVYQGDSKAWGADFLLKGRFKKHEAWIAYSYSKTMEYFPYFFLDEYRYAPQDQRHEIKTSCILNFSPIHLSANYVYGSGFLARIYDNEAIRYPYNRIDVAAIYSFSLKDYTFEAGLSILNLLNTKNIKYANFIRVPVDQISQVNIHAEAVPFTPTIFLNLAF